MAPRRGLSVPAGRRARDGLTSPFLQVKNVQCQRVESTTRIRDKPRVLADRNRLPSCPRLLQHMRLAEHQALHVLARLRLCSLEFRIFPAPTRWHVGWRRAHCGDSWRPREGLPRGILPLQHSSAWQIYACARRPSYDRRGRRTTITAGCGRLPTEAATPTLHRPHGTRNPGASSSLFCGRTVQWELGEAARHVVRSLRCVVSRLPLSPHVCTFRRRFNHIRRGTRTRQNSPPLV